MPGMKIKNYRSQALCIDAFETLPGQAWCLLGANRSGIDRMFALLSGERPPGNDAGVVQPAEHFGVMSFAAQQARFEDELKKDDSDFLDRIDPGTPARQFLNAPEAHEDLIRAFDLDKALDLGYRQLSTGQSRKLLLLAQITQGKQGLLIQAPYEGLDTRGCRELDRSLALCHDRGIRILVTVNNPEDIPAWATHVGVLDQGRMVLSGPRETVLKDMGQIPASPSDFNVSPEDLAAGPATPPNARELVRLENGSAGYGDTLVFTSVSLTMHTGDHTLVTGPNGCGKSTLLSVITGDHPACYQNRLWLFGIRRGTGESIWDLKQNMGIVSPDLHRNYIVPGSTLDCVLSGLFDSIGLYTSPSAADRETAMAWLDRINLARDAHTPFRQLSYADQRLALITRSLIKLPPLLILDEPTQGLDKANREAVLDFLSQVARENLSTILYVSHRQDEYRNFFASRLDMGGMGG